MTTEEINEIHAGGGGICPNCDVEMNQVIEGGIDRFVCPECGYTVDCSEYEFEAEYVEPSDDEIPGGCVAYGCPAYPDCMTACSRFDD